MVFCAHGDAPLCEVWVSGVQQSPSPEERVQKAHVAQREVSRHSGLQAGEPGVILTHGKAPVVSTELHNKIAIPPWLSHDSKSFTFVIVKIKP